MCLKLRIFEDSICLWSFFIVSFLHKVAQSLACRDLTVFLIYFGINMSHSRILSSNYFNNYKSITYFCCNLIKSSYKNYKIKSHSICQSSP